MGYRAINCKHYKKTGDMFVGKCGHPNNQGKFLRWKYEKICREDNDYAVCSIREPRPKPPLSFPPYGRGAVSNPKEVNDCKNCELVKSLSKIIESLGGKP